MKRGMSKLTMQRPMRRSSLISPWGIGSIVPFPNDESLMIAGLDMWRYDHPADFVIKDERLEKRLGVKELRWPPDYREKNADPENYHITIPAVRFPRWYYCPFCGSMRKTTLYGQQPTCDAIQWETGRKCNDKSSFRRRMIPERFIVICPEGHVDDFPIEEWIHYGSGHIYDEGKCHIRRSTGGVSSGLSGVIYKCTCGAGKSIAGATRPNALKRIEYKCKGAKPWLGITGGEECNVDISELRVVLRGATNVWFPTVVSSIYIPTNGDEEDLKIISIVEEYYESISSNRVNGDFNRDVINIIAQSKHVDGDKLYKAFKIKENELEKIPEVDENTTEDEYRFSEYKVLVKSSGNDSQEFHSINHSITEYDKSIHPFFDSISLIPKLRETRAFVGFSRLRPSDLSISENKKTLRLGDGNWVPAIETYGEGIFFEFNKELLNIWNQNADVINRICKMSDSYKASFYGQNMHKELKPEFVLIHTFAHLLINQLSFECGYGSSSIRERIYCEKDDDRFNMRGVLIYTASGDSEGSLGGLVRQGEPGKIEDTIISSLKNAMWCTSDPVCIQSLGQGTDSCNLAACHNCALLPETCCETGNRLLDRGVVIGTIENPEIGFFSSVRNM